MNNEGPSASKSGSVWIWVGGVVAIAIAAGSYVMFGPTTQPSSADLDALVPEVETTEIDTPQTDAVQDNAVATTPQVEPVQIETAEDEQPLDDTQTADEQSGDADAAPVVKSAEAEAEPAAPAIDEVRLAADGVAVVAGRAEPGATVEIIVDGDVVASAEADAGGSFAAVGIVEADDQARVLSLRSVQDGTERVSDDEVIVAPVSQPQPEIADNADSEPSDDTQQVAEGSASDEADPAPLAQAGAVADSDPQPELETQTDVVTTADNQQKTEEAAQDVAQNQTAEAAVGGQSPLAQSNVPDAPSQDSDTAETPRATQAQTAEAAVEEEAPLLQSSAPDAPSQNSAVAETSDTSQIALLKSDEEGVTLLQSAPQPPARIQLDTIGYSDEGAVQLAGRASSEAANVRVYLNNRLVKTLPVSDDSAWRGEVAGVTAGVYTLRVDAIDAAGAVTSRLETPFKRESPEVLAAASADAEGPATAVTVQQGDTLWAIARDRYGEGLLYVQVFEANRSSIRDPDLIYPGQIFELPDDQ